MHKRPVAVLYIHGLARKPPPRRLEQIWTGGLGIGNPMPNVFAPPNSGIDLRTNGVPSFLNYYADVFYDADYETDFQACYEMDSSAELESDGLQRFDFSTETGEAVSPHEQEFLRKFESHLRDNLAPPRMEIAPSAPLPSYEIAGFLPGPVREAIIKKAAMEAYYFLFDKEFGRADGKRFKVRTELRNRLLSTLDAAHDAAERVVVISHSMGTMVAYDVLRNCANCQPVDVLFTLGSPLGLSEVQNELDLGGGGVDFPAAKLGAWLNFYDPLDPICGADPRLSRDFSAVGGKSVLDVKESNWGGWRHTITHYLAGTKLRAAVAESLGIHLGMPNEVLH